MPNQILPHYNFTRIGQKSIWPKVHNLGASNLKWDFKNIWAPIWMIEIHLKLFEISQPDEWKLFYEIFNHSWLRKSFCSCFFLLSPLMVLLEFYVQEMSLFNFYIRLILKFFYVFYLTFNRLLKGLYLGLHEYISWILNLLFNETHFKTWIWCKRF